MDDSEGILIEIEEGILLYSPFVLREYRLILSAMLHSLQSSLSLELYLVWDSTIILYNKEYMGCAGPTNVLSFENFADEKDIFFGDDVTEKIPIISSAIIILSLETAMREACLYGQKKEEYIVFLLAHGLVHAHGYDHGEEMDILVQRCLRYVQEDTAYVDII
ncbi:MAG: rRNA maturation RNase YbeY [Desulfovibrionaceae bacterium]